jgi:hypothetical protein
MDLLPSMYSGTMSAAVEAGLKEFQQLFSF